MALKSLVKGSIVVVVVVAMVIKW